MFSMPLAYPSTLDRRPPGALSAAVAVLRGGALEPEPRVVRGKEQAKANAYCRRLFQRGAPRVFLSQAGPRFGLEPVQAEHHLWFRRCSIAFEQQKGDPLGRPRPAGYAARNLVRMPPGEGLSATGLEPRIEVRPARALRRVGRCSGRQRLSGVCDQHRHGGLCRVGG
jgi:hypothetical protein